VSGSVANPVRLDPWQMIREVHWPAVGGGADIVWGHAGTGSVASTFVSLSLGGMEPAEIPAGTYVGLVVSHVDPLISGGAFGGVSDSAGNSWTTGSYQTGNYRDITLPLEGGDFPLRTNGVGWVWSRLTHPLTRGGSITANWTGSVNGSADLYRGINIGTPPTDVLAEIAGVESGTLSLTTTLAGDVVILFGSGSSTDLGPWTAEHQISKRIIGAPALVSIDVAVWNPGRDETVSAFMLALRKA